MQPPSPAPLAARAAAEPGVAALRNARDRLAACAELPLAEHVTAFEGVHGLLQDALAGVQQLLAGSTATSPEN